MNTINKLKIIQQFLSQLLEKDLYEPIHDIFVAKGYEVRIIHGFSELGKDIVASKVGENVVISVKRGDIDKSRWEKEIQPQLIQLMESEINVNGVNESFPKRALLIISGKLKPLISQFLAQRSKYYENLGENPIEVWDFERLSREIHSHLLDVTLVDNDYFEDIQRLVLSITEKSFDKNHFTSFIDKYLNFEKFSVFKISFSYILRRCEYMKNPYAFFYFAEYALMQIWKRMYSKKDYSRIDKYDEIHSLYIEGLENWLNVLENKFGQKHGLFDSTNGFNEFIEYPLRVFDALRRLAYLALYYLPSQTEGFERATSMIEIVINNNYTACISPLCEFNYNDLGLTLSSLHLSGRDGLAKKWLLDIADFIIVQSLTGHKLLPLGENIEHCTQFLISTPFVEYKSHLLLLLLEFSSILHVPAVFSLIKPHIGSKLSLRARIMPCTENEDEIYEKEVLRSHVVNVNQLQPTLSDFSIWLEKSGLDNKRNYTPIREHRPLLLILVSNIFRDRYFPDVWRNLLTKKNHSQL